MIVKVWLPGVTEAAAVGFIQAQGLRGKVIPNVRCVAAPSTNLLGVEVEMFGPNVWRTVKAALQTALTNNAIPAAVVVVQGGGPNPRFLIEDQGAPLDGAFLFRDNGVIEAL